MKYIYIICLLLTSCFLHTNQDVKQVPQKMDLYAWCLSYQIGYSQFLTGCRTIVAYNAKDIIYDKNEYLSLIDPSKLDKINYFMSKGYRDTVGLSYDCRLALVFTYNLNIKDTLAFYDSHILQNRVYNYKILDSILLTCGYSGIYTIEMKEANGEAYQVPPNSLMK